MVSLTGEAAINACICKSCPSYEECGEKTAFCFLGKSACIKKEKGCLCGACPVHEKMKFKNYYFCRRGAEKSAN